MDFNNASIRRLLSVILAPLFILASAKLGITVSDEVQESIIGLIAFYIAASNTKEAVVKKAEIAGDQAAKDLTREQAKKVIEEASK